MYFTAWTSPDVFNSGDLIITSQKFNAFIRATLLHSGTSSRMILTSIQLTTSHQMSSLLSLISKLLFLSKHFYINVHELNYFVYIDERIVQYLQDFVKSWTEFISNSWCQIFVAIKQPVGKNVFFLEIDESNYKPEYQINTDCWPNKSNRKSI